MPLVNSFEWIFERKKFSRLIKTYLKQHIYKNDLPDRLQVIKNEIRLIDKDIREEKKGRKK